MGRKPYSVVRNGQRLWLDKYELTAEEEARFERSLRVEGMIRIARRPKPAPEAAEEQPPSPRSPQE